MKSSKIKALEEAGWKVGDVSDLLGLSPEELAIIDMKVSLAKNFQELRKKSKLTQTELAMILHTSQSRIAKMEAGDVSVTIDLLVKGMLTLGATKKTVAQVLAN